MPSLKFPKFVSLEGADIHSRTKPDGNDVALTPIQLRFSLSCKFLIIASEFFDSGFRFSLVSYNILAQVCLVCEKSFACCISNDDLVYN